MNPANPHPRDCPAFEYEQHPNRSTELPRQVARLLVGLRSGTLDTRTTAADTRGIHGVLFSNLTPIDQPYYAGHYRGEEFRCLRHYEVMVGNHLGFPAGVVPWRMEEVSQWIGVAIAALDAGQRTPRDEYPEEWNLIHIVQVACRFFELVCRVHPYANGNGHAARFCLWAILSRYGYYPIRWTIEPRPPDPPYTHMLLEYRRGNCEPLELHVLHQLVSEG